MLTLTRWRLLFGLALATMIHVIGVGLLIPAMPFRALALGGTVEDAAWIFSAFSLGAILSGTIWGRLSDAFGRFLMIFVASCLAALAQLGTGMAEQLDIFYLTRFLTGLASGWTIIGQAIAAHHSLPKDRSRALGLMGAGFGIGFTVGPGLYALLDIVWQPEFWQVAAIAAALSSSSGLLVWQVLSRLETQDKSPAKDVPPATSVAAAAPVAAGTGETPAKPQDLPPGLPWYRDQTLAPWRWLLVSAFGFLLMVAIFFQSLEATFAPWTGQLHGYTSRNVGYCLLMSGLLLGFTQGWLVGFLIKKIDEAGTVTVGLSFLVAGTLSGALVDGPLSPILLIGCLAVGYGLFLPLMQGRISLATSKARQGVALGAAYSTSQAARILGPFLGGWIAESFGFSTLFGLAGGIFVVCLPFTFWVMRPLPQTETVKPFEAG